MELIGLFLIASGLLVLAGIAKAFRPEDTARALVELVPSFTSRHVSLGSVRVVVRLGAVTEAALGVCALVLPRPLTAALVASSYALFAVVVLDARVEGGALSTCGCFGRPDTPATWLHFVLNLVLACAATIVALRTSGSGTTVNLLSHQPWAGLPLLFGSGVGLYLTHLALSTLATLEGARRLVQPTAPRAGGS